MPKWLNGLLEKLGRLSCVDVPGDGGKRVLYCLNTGCVVEIATEVADPAERPGYRHRGCDVWLPLY